MALNDFKQHYDNAYQAVFNKVLVAKEVANTRFEPTLKYGESVTRTKYDISSVVVRDTVRGIASTIDTITDSEELLTIDIEKEIAFRLSDGEITQAGPLNPMEVIGRQAAIKLAEDLDYRVFKQVTNALYEFDNGDLTTLSSSGTAITLSSTTVPQMASRLPAKLMRTGNQTISNMVGVFDAYAAADITQYLMGKDIDLAGAAFRNGYAGTVSPMAGASIYVSENLMGEVVLTNSSFATANDTVTILGVTFTAKAIPAVAGEFDIAASADAQGEIIANMINGSATGQNSATGYFEVSAANRAILNDAKVVAVNASGVVTITAAGRIIFSEALTSATATNKLHCYFGKRGGIDLVVQDKSEVDIRQESAQRASIIFSSYLAGVKVFADSAKTFLDVHVLVA